MVRDKHMYNGSISKELRDYKPKVEEFRCNDDCMFKLLGRIIRYAMLDLMCEIEKPEEDAPKYKIQQYNVKKKDKETARLFFLNNDLFLMSGIEFEYLLDAYYRGAFFGKEED